MEADRKVRIAFGQRALLRHLHTAFTNLLNGISMAIGLESTLASVSPHITTSITYRHENGMRWIGPDIGYGAMYWDDWTHGTLAVSTG